jgi:predicted RND superfamily exporter protein
MKAFKSKAVNAEMEVIYKNIRTAIAVILTVIITVLVSFWIHQ